jgi:hypothetical protein
MGRASETLIPARFLLTVGHFVVLILAFYNKDFNVAAALGASPSSAATAAADASFNAVFGLSIVCFALQLYGLMGGATMFADR